MQLHFNIIKCNKHILFLNGVIVHRDWSVLWRLKVVPEVTDQTSSDNMC